MKVKFALVALCASLLYVGAANAYVTDGLTCADTNRNHMSANNVSACLIGGVGEPSLTGNPANDTFLTSTAGAGYGYIGGGGFTHGTNQFGTWEFDSSLWTAYSSIAIGFKFGGSVADTWFVYDVTSGQSSGDYWYSVRGDDRLSHVSLYGVRSSVPEPGALALLGMGLVGLGMARRRAAKAK